jgi:hypothetical protein
MTKPKAPRGCYWRGEVLWGCAKVDGKRYRWSLETDEPQIALARRWRMVNRGIDMEELKRKLIESLPLTRSELSFVLHLIDARVVRHRQGGPQRLMRTTAEQAVIR